MAKTPMQAMIEKNTGISRVTSGTRTKQGSRMRNAARRKSRGGQGG